MDLTSRTDSSWVRIFNLERDNWLVFDGADDLRTGRVGGPLRAVDPMSPIGLLPCLQKPLGAFLRDLLDRDLELGLPQGTLDGLVPWRAIPAVAVEAQSSYWAELAVGWLEEMLAEDRDGRLLEELERSNWASQETRHRAKRLLRDVKR